MKKRIIYIILIFQLLTFISYSKETNLIIHYQKSENLDWDLWIWAENMGGNEYKFTKEDDFGMIAEIKLNGSPKKVGYIVRTPDWSRKDISEDRYIDINQNGTTKVWIKSNDKTTYYRNPDKEIKKFSNLKLNINFLANDDMKNWYVLAFNENETLNEAKEFKMNKKKNFLEADVEIKGKDISKINFIIAKKINGKYIYDQDVKTLEFDEIDNQKIYIVQDDMTLYFDKDLAVSKNYIEISKIDKMNVVTVVTNKPINLKKILDNGYSFNFVNKVEKIVPINGTNNQTKEFQIYFEKNLDINNKNLKININNLDQKNIVLGNVVRDETFDKLYYYDKELGSIYSKKETIFKVWAPTADYVNLLVYKDDNVVKYKMKKENKGVYTYTLKGDMLNLEYNYEVKVLDKLNIATDPYAKATTVNGKRSVVVNPKISNVKNPNYEYLKYPIIYELHTRDFSIHSDSGIKNKGKFLAFTESNTKTKNGETTGIDYIKNLGITHIQLLPIYDFSENSVDEENPDLKYNWGYDPVNYNVVEGSYSTNPYLPSLRIEELQKAIDFIHEKNIGVIMDVVYNHVYSAIDHSFNKIVPGYFYRVDENGNLTNGTGVGNDIASERLMVRKYIVDSAKYWAKTFKLDGFRFDLMGILDIDTMNKIKEEVLKINPNFFILGEGWDMGTLDPKLRATQNNANKLDKISFFNDDFRDLTKGSTFGNIGQGFISGKIGEENKLFNNIKGGQGIKTYLSPRQLIQYVEAHDNLTLYDQLKRTNSNEDEETIKKRHNLATSIVLLSQGVPFIHAGQEFLRTKYGDENSYKSGDKINRLDWNLMEKNMDSVNYFKELINIRKSRNDLFNMNSFDEVNKKIEKIVIGNGVIAYKLDDLIIIYNATKSKQKINIKEGIYNILVDQNGADKNSYRIINIKDGIYVEPISTTILEIKK